MLWLAATDNAQNTFTLDYSAVFATRFYRRLNLHDPLLPLNPQPATAGIYLAILSVNTHKLPYQRAGSDLYLDPLFIPIRYPTTSQIVW